MPGSEDGPWPSPEPSEEDSSSLLIRGWSGFGPWSRIGRLRGWDSVSGVGLWTRLAFDTPRPGEASVDDGKETSPASEFAPLPAHEDSICELRASAVWSPQLAVSDEWCNGLAGVPAAIPCVVSDASPTPAPLSWSSGTASPSIGLGSAPLDALTMISQSCAAGGGSSRRSTLESGTWICDGKRLCSDDALLNAEADDGRAWPHHLLFVLKVDEHARVHASGIAGNDGVAPIDSHAATELEEGQRWVHDRAPLPARAHRRWRPRTRGIKAWR